MEFQDYAGYIPLIYQISNAIIMILMLIVITSRKRHFNSAMAWLLVVFFHPWLGVILYAMFGTPKLSPGRVAKTRKLQTLLPKLRCTLEEDGWQIIHPNLASHYEPVVQLAESLGDSKIQGGNSVQILVDTNRVIEEIVQDIDEAKHYVHMMFYIFANDETGQKVIDALGRAVQRGVTCRLLVDYMGSRQLVKEKTDEIRALGIEFESALKVNWIKLASQRMDIRNHRKVVIVDGTIGYTGSQNIVNADYGHKNLAWHDMMLRLGGPIIHSLQWVFISDWYYETDEFLDDERYFICDSSAMGGVAVQTLACGPLDKVENYQRMVVYALYTATRDVILTSPYFIPDAAFLQAMQVAVMRGVRVRLILPKKSDQILVGGASWAYYEELLEMGVEIHLYQPGLIHSKTMTVDDAFAFVGTSNFDIRSFELNFELNLVLYEDEVVRQLRWQQDVYLASSDQLTFEKLYQVPLWRRIVRNSLKLLSPIL